MVVAIEKDTESWTIDNWEKRTYSHDGWALTKLQLLEY